MTRMMLVLLGLALVISCANKQQMALLRSDAGDRHSEQGAYEAAIAAYGEAIALDPKNPSSRISLGKVYAAMDRFDEASGLVRSVVELNPADGAAQALLGQLELARGRYPESLAGLSGRIDSLTPERLGDYYYAVRADEVVLLPPIR